MKILIAAGIYPPDAGGPAVHAKAQFDGFPALGAKTGLVALAHYRGWPRGIRHLLYFLKLLTKIPGYDVVYAHDAVGSGILALIAARLFGKKFMVRTGGDLAWEHHAESAALSLKEWYAQGGHINDQMFRLSRWLMRHADFIVVPSPLMVELYKEYYEIDPAKIKLILNPIPETRAGVEAQEQTVIWASRLATYKNLPIAIRAFAKVFASYPELKFIIMGDGPEAGSLKELVKELSIERNVILADRSSQAEVLARTATCLFTIAPALTEFNPNYVLQGIGFGKPFLISREHGLPFQVPEYLTFDPRNEGEIRERIIALLGENREKAREYVSNLDLKMSWEDNLKANLELMRGLLNAKSS